MTSRSGNNNEAPRDAAEAVSVAIALAGGAPAVLTMPLDAGRHLRLRICCALERRSAQAILADALDAHLGTIAGVERIAAEAEGGVAANRRGTDR